MARPALMEKLMQPAKWLFRKELIPLDDILGDIAGAGLKVLSSKLNVDFSEMPASQLRPMVLAMIQTGGGLMVDSQGKIYFDPTSMDTAVFDNMLKALWIPKPLTANTTFYVDKSHAQAANTLIEGRGLSPALPFASVNACVKYVCENYNFGDHNATIKINDGCYYENVTLPDYTSTSGILILQPYTMNDSGRNVIIRNPTGSLGYTMQVSGSKTYSLYHIAVECMIDPTSVAQTAYVGAFQLTNSALVRFYGNRFEIKFTEGSFATGDALGVSANLLVSGSNGNVYLYKDSMLPLNFIAPASMPDGAMIRMLSASGGAITLVKDRVGGDTHKALCAGEYTTVAVSESKGEIRTSGAGSYAFSFEAAPGRSLTGRRYQCLTGGSINTGGQGPDYFPGNIAGTVEADTYAWYK